jgi:hypothetical protein
MLAGGRLVNEERRHLHYEAMAVDSSRLRLVKELLNFGRMQTDAMRYRRDWFTAICSFLSPTIKLCGQCPSCRQSARWSR